MRIRHSIAAGFIILCFCSPAYGQDSGSIDVVKAEKREVTGKSLPGSKFVPKAFSPELDFSRFDTIQDDKEEKVAEFKPTGIENFHPSLYSPGLNFQPYRTPFIRNEVNGGMLATWMGFGIMGRNTYEEHPHLLVTNGVALGLSRDFGQLSFNIYGSVNMYSYNLARDKQFGIEGDFTYTFNDNVSATVFGQFYDKVPAYSMAAYPFVDTQRFGGYMTVHSDRVGVDLGVEKYYDPMRMEWITQPIVTPKVKLWDSVYIGVPLGGAIRYGYDRAMQKRMMKNAPPPPPSQHRPPPPPPRR